MTPFSLATGVALVIGYALLGATWLVMKTEGDISERAGALPATRLRDRGCHGRLQLWTPFLEAP